MATIDRPVTHREELGIVIDAANRRFSSIVGVITLFVPAVAYLSGSASALFYVHVALGAFWFGLDFFFKFVLGPALDALAPAAANRVNREVVPKMVVVAEPLSVGVIGSGIGLASLLGYWADPSIWLWGALGIGIAMLLVGFGPLHLLTTKMVVELDEDDPDQDRLDSIFQRTLRWGLLQTVLMLAIIAMMVGMRGV
ncbi:MAG: hypothetical protein ABEJ27_00840 [Halodesulfurarchaeum sp.]